MARYQTNPEHLFDHTWRAGHPFRPRLGRWRRWGMRILLVLLCALIGGYWYITGAERVRQMAETYLSSVLGAPVEVKSAHLSVFEGLRLDDVKVHVDDARQPDSVVLSAQSFQIAYDPLSIIRGRLEATTVRAISPRVRLVHHADTGGWNIQRLLRDRRSASRPADSGPPIAMPEIDLRDARLDVMESIDGRVIPAGSLAVEGLLRPGTEPYSYDFSLQSRGQFEGLGPSLTGSFSTATGQVNLRLANLQLDDDIRSLCPDNVREFLWDQHKLAGRIGISQLSYTPARGDRPAAYKVVADLDGVSMTVNPDEWRSEAETAGIRSMRDTFAMMGRAGMNLAGGQDLWAEPFGDEVIRLDHVSGRFVFTEKEIRIENLVGLIETNGIRVNGRIASSGGSSPAYSLRCPFELHVESLESQNITIPKSPRYLSALPAAVQELYDRFRPTGALQLDVKLARRVTGGEVGFDGLIRIVDGDFRFDRFPYPLRRVRGDIVIEGGEGRPEKLTFRNMRGLGIERGPNRDVEITVNGEVGPLNDDAGVNVVVRGKDINGEPALLAAFPADVRRALRGLDAQGTGLLPVFNGDFECRIDRPVGPEMPWTIDTDVSIHRAHAMLKAFPYPLRDVAMELKIRDDFLEITSATMRKGDATLAVSGRIDWAPPLPGSNEPVIRPSLNLSARGVPVDKDLLQAVPAAQRQWIEKIGLKGTVDCDGKITPAEGDDFAWDVLAALKGGSAWPVEGAPAVSDLSIDLHLTPGKIVFSKLKGRRGTSSISGQGEVALVGDAPRLIFSAKAGDLALDDKLRAILPAEARAAWDQVKPVGTVDAEITFSGDASALSSGPGAQGGKTGFEVRLRPRKLTILPDSIPYLLEDLAGEITIRNDKVELNDLKARHGKGALAIGGSIDLGDRGAWDLSIGGRDVALDDDLRKALPDALLSLVRDSKLEGQIDFAFPRIVYRPANEAVTAPSATQPAGRADARQARPADVDFQGEMTLKQSSIDMGVSLQDMDAKIQLDGATRAGRLARLKGKVEASKVKVAGRSARNVRAELFKSESKDVLQVTKLTGQLAGGEVAGQFEVTLGTGTSPGGYALNLVLRQADVAELAGETDKNIHGQLTASLSLEGTWGQPASQRGRGDVLVAGKQMYRVPMVLGFLQITNLSLPISAPFTEGSARYSVRGRVVTVESLELKSNSMTMSGSGQLNFDTRKVRMAFTTDNPNAIKIPLITELMQGLKQELLQIQVRGSIEEPKVSGAVMNTFQTTIDEVFKPGTK